MNAPPNDRGSLSKLSHIIEEGKHVFLEFLVAVCHVVGPEVYDVHVRRSRFVVVSNGCVQPGGTYRCVGVSFVQCLGYLKGGHLLRVKHCDGAPERWSLCRGAGVPIFVAHMISSTCIRLPLNTLTQWFVRRTLIVLFAEGMPPTTAAACAGISTALKLTRLYTPIMC